MGPFMWKECKKDLGFPSVCVLNDMNREKLEIILK